MIKIVKSIDAYHVDHVSNAVDRIQSEGYAIKKIQRVSKMKLGIFGEDVTYIYYD